MSHKNSIRQGPARKRLDQLHSAAKGDRWRFLAMAPKLLPVLELLKVHMRRGTVVLADNIFTFRRALRPYVEYMQSGKHGFSSTTLHLGDGFEYSVYLG